jgi:biopolymer transport protein ExbD
VPSVAMGDIAFLLLIFYFILARAEDDSHLRWKPADVIKVENLGTTDLSIVINEEFKTFLNGGQIGNAQLAGVLEKRLEGRGPGFRKVRLKVDRATPAQYFEPVIEAISQAGGELEHVLEEKQEK